MNTLESTLSNTTVASSRYLPWFICLTAALFFFYEFIQMNILSSLNQELMRDFGINATQLGVLSSFYFWANVIFLIPAGLLLDRFSTRKIILITLGICIFGTFMFAHASNMATASVFRFLTGIGSAFCFLSCIRLASRWFPPSHMALITGLIVTMAMLGGMIAQTPLAMLTESIGWHNAVLADAGLGLVIFFMIWLVVQDQPADFHLTKTETQQEKQTFWHSLKTAYAKKQNWCGAFYTCLMNLPIFLLGGLWGSLYLTQVRGLATDKASLITSMIFLGTIIGSPTAGWLSDKMGRRKRPMFIGGILSLGLILLLMYTPQISIPGLVSIFFLLGLTTSTQIISYPTITESNSHALTATAVSVISITTIGGGAIFQPVFGRIMDLQGKSSIAQGIHVYSVSAYNHAMTIMPIAFIVALIAAALLKETFCTPNECR